MYKWDPGPRSCDPPRRGRAAGPPDLLRSRPRRASLQFDPLLTGAHLDAAPGSAFSHRERVPLQRLDSLEGLFVDWCLEMSLVDLYEGQPLLREMLDHADRQGYELHDLRPGFFDRKRGRLLQVDGVGFRRPEAERPPGDDAHLPKSE